jgi:hypothetical protein
MTVGGTLTFTDGEFVDVSVNGVALVAGTDYNTTTANTIGGLSALSANDQVEIVVYDTFSVFGGNVNGDFTVSNGTLTAGTTSLDGAVTINESSADVDFRVESDGNANMLTVNAGDNRVGIGCDPERDLHVKGASGDPVHFKLEGDASDYARIMFDDGTDDNIGEIRYDFGSDFMQFTVNAGEAFRVDSSRNLGIGVTDIRHPLHIAYSETGSIPTDHQIGASSDNKNYIGVHNTSNSATYSGIALETRTSGATRWLIANEYQSDFVGDLVFRTRDGGTSGSEIVRFTNDSQLKLTSTAADANAGPKIALIRDSSSPADGDSTGSIIFNGDDSAGNLVIFSEIQSVLRDVTDTAEDGELQLNVRRADSLVSGIKIGQTETVVNEDSQNVDFRVESDGNANMLIVDAGNNSVMVGDNTGASYSDGGLFTRHAGGANNASLCVVNGTTSGTLRLVDFFGGTSTSRVGSIQVESGSVAFNTSSDYRLKENVNYTWDATTRLKQLKPVQFNWISDDTNTAIDGFLAHEVSSVVPSAISGEKDEVWTDGSPMYQQIDQSKLVPLLVKTIQELEARIATLEAG